MNLSRIVPQMGCYSTPHAEPGIDSQTSENPVAYNLKVSVDEVELTFHASDAQGLSVNDLRLDEFSHLRQQSVAAADRAFRNAPRPSSLGGHPHRTSSSMEQNLPTDRAIAAAYVERLLRQKTDQAFVMDFGRRSQMRRTWSNNPDLLLSAIQETRVFPSTTAIFDTIYAVCRYQFGKLDPAPKGNLILLFSDGEDDASFLSLQTAVSMCQQTNTAIYAFHAESTSGSMGTGTLAQLASQTGGRVFRDNVSAREMDEDLHWIEANLRNQYRWVYDPAQLDRDGTFHRIVILPPPRVANIHVRSGYYAPSR